MTERTPGSGRAHAIAAACVAGLALLVYARTAYPGLVMIGDSPKFQFVGAVWGTPHNPGYPLYVVLSHVFGLLPFGSLAFKMNILSSVFGAMAAGLVTLFVCRLTGATLAGVGAGLFLAFGRVFWSQSIIAEVYTLSAALLAGVLLFLFRWIDTKRDRDLLMAAGVFGLALGNHLTVLVVAPSLALLVILTAPRALVRPRVLAGIALLLSVGVAQYGLVLYWTQQGSPYLESSAHNLRELWAVMSGGQFQNRLMVAGVTEVVELRVPALLSTVASELQWWGCLIALAGFARLARRNWRLAASLAAGCLSVVAFVANYDMADPEVLLIPVFILIAPAVGSAIAGLTARLTTKVSLLRRTAAVLLAVTPAAVLLAGNFKVSDHSKRTYETRLMSMVFGAVPDGAAIVPGTFAEHLMVAYLLHGEGYGKARGIESIPLQGLGAVTSWRAGRRVYAFPDAKEELARTGAVFEPVAAFDGSPVLFRLVAITECADIGNAGWTDIGRLATSGIISGRIDNYRPFLSRMEFQVSATQPLTPRLETWTGPGQPSFSVTGVPSSGPRHDYVIRVEVNDDGQFGLFRLAFGGPVAEARANITVDLNNPRRATLCTGASMTDAKLTLPR